MSFLKITGCKHLAVDTQKKKYAPENQHNMGAFSVLFEGFFLGLSLSLTHTIAAVAVYRSYLHHLPLADLRFKRFPVEFGYAEFV